jgi:hypothetical protein
MYQDLWVATDGITTVRFPDRQSAIIYCAETGWDEQALYIIRTPVVVDADGAIIPDVWRNRMDPDADCEIPGTWVDSDTVFVPPSQSMLGGFTKDDQPVTISPTYLHKIGVASERLGWGFRDLAARTEEIQSQVFSYLEMCNAHNKKPNLQEIEKIVGVYAN